MITEHRVKVDGRSHHKSRLARLFVIRRDLAIGMTVSLLLHGAFFCFGERFFHSKPHLRIKESISEVELIEMPLIDPEVQEDPEVLEMTDQKREQSPGSGENLSPVQNDIPPKVILNMLVQASQPPRPSGPRSIDISALFHGIRGRGKKEGAGAGDGVGIFDFSSLDRAPVPIVQVRPQYPMELKREGVEGDIVVDFIVDKDGRVRNAYAVNASRRELEIAAVMAITNWRFRPGSKDGRTVNTHMRLPIEFTLNSNR